MKKKNPSHEIRGIHANKYTNKSNKHFIIPYLLIEHIFVVVMTLPFTL